MKKTFVAFFVIIVLVSFSMGQTVIWSEDFESSGGYNTSITEFTDGSTDYFIRTNGSDISGDVSFNNNDGYYFAAQDIDAEGSSIPVTLTFENIDITNYTNLEFLVSIAEDDDGSNQDWDSPDYIHIDYDIDNSAILSPLIWIENDGTATNSAPFLDMDFDGNGEGTEISNTFANFTSTITTTGNNIDISITFYLNSGDEDIAIDNLMLKGTQTSVTPDPEPSNHVTNFLSNTIVYDQIDLTWIDATGPELPLGYLIIANTTNTFSDPVDGIDPVIDIDLSDNEAVIKVSQGTEFYSLTGLNESTKYYFKIWPYSNSGFTINYKTDGIVPADDATTNTAPETISIIINEIHADPDAINGDANGDGTINTSQDEFIELYNNEDTFIDISGWTISDATRIRHIFPSNTILQSKSAIVIFGGGTPIGLFGGAVIQTASTGTLSLNNAGEIITIMNGTTTIVTYHYGSEGGDNQSITRNPDITGNFVKHSVVIPGFLFSPGKKNDGDNSLPVTISSFIAKSRGGKVFLEWKTESEINNLGFNIYRQQSENEYEKINKTLIKGAGNSSTANTYSYKDENVIPEQTYHYKLEDISTEGRLKTHKSISIKVESDDKTFGVVNDFKLYPVYPNPCNPSSTIQYNIPKKSIIKINIYDLKGNLIKILENTTKLSGEYKILWDGKNNNNNQVGNGIYFVQLTTNTGFASTEKIVLLK